MATDTIPVDELRELKEEIAALRSDMNRYTTDTPRLRAASLVEDFRNTCADAIADSFRDTGCDAVGSRAGDCAMWEKCSPVFATFFEDVVNRVRSGELSPEVIEEIHSGIARLKARAPSERCESCFAEAEKQLNNQLSLFAAIGVGRKKSDPDTAVRSLPEEEAATIFSDALASPVRIQVLKALYDDGKTFTELSKLTGLRGGNLLFHLEKMMKSGIIQQKGDRGVYHITYRGYEVAGAAAELYQKII
jgi:DNA-binding transcriptional ArsR family regulator